MSDGLYALRDDPCACVKRPQTNGKAGRIIKTLPDMWHEQAIFGTRQDRQISLARFINFYDTARVRVLLMLLFMKK